MSNSARLDPRFGGVDVRRQLRSGLTRTVVFLSGFVGIAVLADALR